MLPTKLLGMVDELGAAWGGSVSLDCGGVDGAEAPDGAKVGGNSAENGSRGSTGA